MQNLLYGLDFERLSGPVAAGQAQINPGAFSLGTHRAAALCVLTGAVAAGGTLTVRLEASADDGATDPYGEFHTVQIDETDADKPLIIDVVDAQLGWIRPVIDRAGADSALDSILIVRHQGRKMPEPNAGISPKSATVLGIERGQP